MFGAALLVLLTLNGPANHQVIRPSPNQATVTMARFVDNDRRLFIEDFQRERALAHRQAVIAHRVELADQLDRLIAIGDCGQARSVADNAGYRDIREAVTRICDAPAQTN